MHHFELSFYWLVSHTFLTLSDICYRLVRKTKQALRSSTGLMGSSLFLAGSLQVDVCVDRNLSVLHGTEKGVWEAEICSHKQREEVTPCESISLIRAHPNGAVCALWQPVGLKTQSRHQQRAEDILYHIVSYHLLPFRLFWLSWSDFVAHDTWPAGIFEGDIKLYKVRTVDWTPS